MKTFNEFKTEESKNLFEGKLPTFTEFNKAIEEENLYIEDILESVGSASKEVRAAVEAVHAIQLNIQQIESDMLTTREEFLSIPKEDTKGREPHKKKLVELNKKKVQLQSDLAKAQKEFERALSRDQGEEGVDINLL